ncbi:hypothetical protein [Streptomyces erythrochromogenes]|uniref:hypothetical protein n=1 Tax=Streptomyces erythrochromogenes TaxID=285574 RepID=UPI0037D58790
MSQTEFFAFVEGVNIDGYVHGGNCDRALSPIGVGYRLSPADELPGEGGGKTRLKKYYEYLDGRSSLVTNFKGKTTVVVFFLDKDVDDQLGLLISTPHVIYTQFYDVENHVFDEGNVAEAVGAACSLPPNWCREEFGPQGAWQAAAAGLWIDWTRLCFLAKVLKVPGAVNYGRPSPLNTPSHEPADPMLAAKHEGDLRSSYRSATPDHDWHSARSTVETAYSIGNWDNIFKGKWYAQILSSQIQANCPNRIDIKNLAASLVKHVAATMSFASAWSISVQKAVESLALLNGLGAAQGDSAS